MWLGARGRGRARCTPLALRSSEVSRDFPLSATPSAAAPSSDAWQPERLSSSSELRGSAEARADAPAGSSEFRSMRRQLSRRRPLPSTPG